MSDILLYWLNHELQLSTRITHVETDFASGYLLGEILHQLNQQHNFADFMDSTIADAKIINFCLVEPSLRNMGIKFDSKVATAIMNETPGAAANILYQIKMAAERLKRAPDVSTKSLERNSIQPLHNMPGKLAKPIYDAYNHHFFEHSIRRHVRSVVSLEQEKAGVVEEKKKREAYLKSLADQKELLEITKAERLHRAFIHSQFIKVVLEETDSPAWRLAIQKKNEREQRKARFYRQLLAHREKREEEHTFSLRRTVNEELDEFETRNGQRSKTTGTKIPSKKSVGYGLQSLSAAFAKSERSSEAITHTSISNYVASENSDAKANAHTIKEQKHHRIKRIAALERRRKRFLQECGYHHSHLTIARVTSTLETLVLRETCSERDVRKETESILLYKEIARENRRLREEEYDKQRNCDNVAAVDRDSSAYECIEKVYADSIRMQDLQQQRLKDAICAADHYRGELIAQQLLHDLIDFVIFIAGKREQSLYGRDPSLFLVPETWTEYKVQFANGCLVNVTKLTMEGQDANLDLLNQWELNQYLTRFRSEVACTASVEPTTKQLTQSPWCPKDSKFIGSTKIIDDCVVLGEAIKYVRWTTRTDLSIEAASRNSEMEQQPPQTIMGSSTPITAVQESKSQLRVLIFGPPFAGKKTQAVRLAEKYNLALLSIHQLIRMAIETKSDLHQELLEHLSSGDEISPMIYSQLVRQAILLLDIKHDDDDTRQSGWILYDLPGTATHAQNLEELLTGYVDPELIPSPYDLESAIAPGYTKPKLPSDFLYGKSGVDLVFYLNCEPIKVMERCLGQVQDEATGENYHLVSNPPPAQSIDRHRLRHVNPTLDASEFLTIQCLANDTTSCDLKHWYSKFDTLRDIEASEWGLDATHHEIVKYIEQFHKHQEDKKLADLRNQEAAEVNLMIDEDQRQRQILDLENAIIKAQEDHTNCEHALKHAEEIKAKKEELVELRHALDTAHHHVEAVISAANAWVHKQHAIAEAAKRVYSNVLEPSMSRILATMWDNMEKEYMINMKKCLYLLREQRLRVSNRAQDMVDEFCDMMRRSDTKQMLINQFQQQFNQVIDEMRFDDATKQELHARTDVLQDELCTLIETKVAENNEELSNVLTDGWVENTCQRVAIIYQMALQAECDRFHVTYQFLVDCFSAAAHGDSTFFTSVKEKLSAHQSQLDLVCRVYYDPSAVIPTETVAVTPAAAAPSGKSVPKGKRKSVTPPPGSGATVPPAGSPDASNQENDPMDMDQLLLMYEQVLEKCKVLVLILSPTSNDIPDPHSADPNPDSIDLNTVNFVNGIKFEHELMQKRVEYLRDSSQTTCDQITQTMRSVEMTLRDTIEERKHREQASVTALIKYIRSSIEAEVNLPSFINTQPESIYRFPIIVQLREDTLVTVDSMKRLIPFPPVDPPPVVEEVHDVLLNTRQREQLSKALKTVSSDGYGRKIALNVLIEVMIATASIPHALPKAWKQCREHVFGEIGAGLVEKSSGLVDIESFLMVMCEQEELLKQHLGGVNS